MVLILTVIVSSRMMVHERQRRTVVVAEAVDGIYPFRLLPDNNVVVVEHLGCGPLEHKYRLHIDERLLHLPVHAPY